MGGNNYKLIINGDLFQHSRLENPQTEKLASALTNLVESAPKGSVMFTVGNHDVGMFIERYKNPNKEEMEEIGEFAKYYR
ncbi:MAG: metallophosphoesterase [Candidatus Pacearchaeota archaeon]